MIKLKNSKRIKLLYTVFPILILIFSIFFITAEAFGQKTGSSGKKPVAEKSAKRKILPDLKLPDLAGKQWSLYANRGRVVMINFWATWCTPCREETPILVKLDKEYRSRGLEIVGIALDDNGNGNIKKFAAEYGVDYPMLLPVPGSLLSRIDPVPTTLIIDPEGRLAKKYVGAMPEDTLRADIEGLIKTFGVKKEKMNDSQKTKQTLTILHTNDIHGHLRE